MIQQSHPSLELYELLELMCESRLTANDMRRLEELVACDPDALRIYLEYIELHGTLYWDTAIGCPEPPAFTPSVPESNPEVALRPPGIEAESSQPKNEPNHHRWRFPFGLSHGALFVSMSAVGFAVVGVALLLNVLGNQDASRPFVATEDPSTPPVFEDRQNEPAGLPPEITLWANAAPETTVESGIVDSRDTLQPERSQSEMQDRPEVSPPVPSETEAIARVRKPPVPDSNVITDPTEFANAEIRKAWKDADVHASPVADDSEWVRRIHLDLVGHIPSADRVSRFLADQDEQKREVLVEELLQSPDYARNWGNLWTNLLIGRSEIADVDRAALEDFLRTSFSENRPWKDIVADLVAAEGDQLQNGATNFLLAHLNNEAVPATAVTARVLMGVQLQCAQCHNHPFNREQQNEFWELHSFFQQTSRVVRNANPRAGSPRSIELVSRQVGGPMFFETLKGVTKTAYPKFGGVGVDPSQGINRRKELARLMAQGKRPQIAAAMVNRIWEHFFGYGFTRPVDDMGPHNPPSHAALLDGLTQQFVASGYDVKQLFRWIVATDAYQLTSQYNDSNVADSPSTGASPLFSRMYLKSLTAEQLYDSLIVATRGDQTLEEWSDIDSNRRLWMQQFIIDFDTEENSEVTHFEGTMSQALMMMNGELVEHAIALVPGSFLDGILAEESATPQKIEQLFLSALSRYPSRTELHAANQLIRLHRHTTPPNGRNENEQLASRMALQDLYWSALNSNEFIVNH